LFGLSGFYSLSEDVALSTTLQFFNPLPCLYFISTKKYTQKYYKIINFSIFWIKTQKKLRSCCLNTTVAIKDKKMKYFLCDFNIQIMYAYHYWYSSTQFVSLYPLMLVWWILSRLCDGFGMSWQSPNWSMTLLVCCHITTWK